MYLIQSDNEVTVTPFPTAPTKEEKEKIIEVGERSMDAVRRELTSAYINNCTSIRFTKIKKSEDILRLLEDFVALEIVDQSESSVLVKDLLNLADINIDQSLRRMDMIIRTLFKEDEAREKDLNKLYFLMYRLLKGAMHDQKMADALNLKQENILLTWYMMVNLEHIGDVLEKVKKKAGLKDVEKNYLTAVKAYFTKDKALAENVLSAWQDSSEKSSKMSQDQAEQVRQLNTYVNNIARSTLDLD